MRVRTLKKLWTVIVQHKTVLKLRFTRYRKASVSRVIEKATSSATERTTLTTLRRKLPSPRSKAFTSRLAWWSGYANRRCATITSGCLFFFFFFWWQTMETLAKKRKPLCQVIWEIITLSSGEKWELNYLPNFTKM